MVSERARKCRNTCSVQVGDMQTPGDCKAGEGFQRRHSLTGRESMPDTGREETGQKDRHTEAMASGRKSYA